MTEPFDLRVVLEELVDPETAQLVLERLAADDVRNAVTERLHAAESAAVAAWLERPDLYSDPGDSRTAAEIAAAAVMSLIAPSPPAPTPPVPQVAAKVLQLTYKDWAFKLVRLPSGDMAIRVTAPLDDSYHPGNPFCTTRTAVIRGADVVSAAYRAILQIEEHEIRERLSLGGQPILDPHSTSFAAAPTNHRASAD